MVAVGTCIRLSDYYTGLVGPSKTEARGSKQPEATRWGKENETRAREVYQREVGQYH